MNENEPLGILVEQKGSFSFFSLTKIHPISPYLRKDAIPPKSPAVRFHSFWCCLAMRSRHYYPADNSIAGKSVEKERKCKAGMKRSI
jgi:hypothetical protein